MYAKLFKHEFLATWRMLATVGAVTVLVGFSLLLPAWVNLPVLGPTGQALGFIAFVVGAALVPILLGVNYWRTMYAGPGYFTHTLPVRGRALYIAKVTYACLASLVALLIGLVLAFGVAGVAVSAHQGYPVGDIWAQITAVISPGQLWGLLVAILVVSGAEYVVLLSSITLGTRGVLGGLGLGGVILGLVIAYFVYEIVGVISLFAVPFSLHLQDGAITGLAFRWMGFGMFTGQVPEYIGIGAFPMTVVLAIIAAIWAARSVERHTSLL